MIHLIALKQSSKTCICFTIFSQLITKIIWTQRQVKSNRCCHCWNWKNKIKQSSVNWRQVNTKKKNNSYFLKNFLLLKHCQKAVDKSTFVSRQANISPNCSRTTTVTNIDTNMSLSQSIGKITVKKKRWKSKAQKRKEVADAEKISTFLGDRKRRHLKIVQVTDGHTRCTLDNWKRQSKVTEEDIEKQRRRWH